MAASLGVLTLDLVAKIGNFVQPLNQAENKVKATFNNIRESANKYGPAVLGAASAAAAGLAALTLEAVNSATEIQRIATVAGVTSSQLQYMAVGAKELGIEQDKLGDILADVREKMGEYVSTEGGGMADFFEQIAPKIGVTAEQFAKLSGAEGLQLYASSLEKAGVSQERMRFYMESFASDSTMLLPLLLNNGAGFKIFGDEAERVGGILSNDVLNQTNQLRAGQFLLEQQVKGLKNELVTGTLPVLVDLADAFSNSAGDGTRLVGISDLVNVTLRSVAATALGAAAAVNLFGKTLATAATGAKSAWDGFDLKRLLFSPAGLKDTFLLGSTNFAVGAKEGMSDIRATIDAEATRINKAWGNVDTKSKLDDLASFYGKLAELQKNNGDIGAIGSKAAAEAQKSANQAAQDAKNSSDQLQSKYTDLLYSMNEQSTLIGKTGETSKLVYRMMYGDLSKLSQKQKENLELTSRSLEQREKQYQFEQSKKDLTDQLAIARTLNAEDQKTLELRKQFFEYSTDQQAELIIYSKRLDAIKEFNDVFSSNKTDEEAANAETTRQLNAINYGLQNVTLSEKEYQQAIKARQALIGASVLPNYTPELSGAGNPALIGSGAKLSGALGQIEEATNAGVALDDSYVTQKDLLREQYEGKEELATEYNERMLALDQEYADKRMAVEMGVAEGNKNLMLERLDSAESLSGSLADIAASTAGKQSGIYKAMFAVEKGFAIAKSVMAIQTAMASAAMSLPFPGNLGAMATVASSVAGIVSTIQSVNMDGFADGGYTGAGGKYDPAGIVHKGEVVWSQSDIKRAGGVGNVESMRKGGNSGGNIYVNNYSNENVKTSQDQDGNTYLTIGDVRKEIDRYVPAQLSNPNSRISKSLGQNTQTMRRR